MACRKSFVRLGLLADDEIGGGNVALRGGTVPEDAVGARCARGGADGVEDLDAVSGPFAVAGGLLWRGQYDAALGAQLVQENAPAGRFALLAVPSGPAT